MLECKKCRLHEGRQNVVIGEGPSDADIMLIGEAPGANEDKTGRPFVGRAGKILDEALEGAGLAREDVFIGNIVKCRPPSNRNPKKDEIASCTPFLDMQMASIRPKVLVPMGNFPTGYVMERFGLDRRRIGEVRGKIFDVETPWGGAAIVPIYHPAATIYNQRLRPVLQKDFKLIGRFNL